MPDVITDNLDLWTSVLLTKSTAGRGSNGKQAAYGIKKLRELILGTALRGLFNKENEWLPETIEEVISNARNAYYKSIGKKPKEYLFGPPLLHEFKLPGGWAWKRVGELCDLQTGATPNTHKPEYFGGDIRWLVSGDINQGIIEDCEGRITEAGLSNSNCKVLPPDTVLIALNGQGKTRASVALLNVPAACNQSLVGMIPFDTSILDPMFLLLSLRYRYYEIRDITGQNQRRGLNMGLVAELSIPLPPLGEQHSIVAKVDELMALCDQLEQQQTHSIEAHQTLVETLLGTLARAASPQELAGAWARISSHFDTLFPTEHSIDQLKQTIVELAVRGKLVDQDTSDEPASMLLEGAAKEKALLIREGKIRKQKELPPIAEDEVPFRLPNSWHVARLGTVSHLITKGTTPTSLGYAFVHSGIAFVKVENIDSGRIQVGSISEFIDERTNKALQRSQLVAGDLLFSIAGTIGKTCIVYEEDLPANTNQALAIIRGSSTVFDSRYLLIQLDSYVAEATRSKARGGAMPNVSLGDLTVLVLPVPPLAEQHRIVAKVDELMALCDALKARLTDAQTTQLHLADAIVEQAVA